MSRKYIKGYDNKYQILEDGRVFSVVSKKFIKPRIVGNHKSVSLCKNGYYTSILVERLLKEYFEVVIKPLEVVESLDGEEWVCIKGYEGLYEISNLGRVKSLSRERKKMQTIIKPKFNKKGNLEFSVSKNNKKESKLLHRELAIAFVPNPYKKKLAVHLNGNKSDNRLENIVWFTNSENIVNARKLKLLVNAKGVDSNCSIKVNQYTLDGLHLIKTWDCITDVEREIGIFRSNIVKVCKGKRNSTGGYFWSYFDEEE